jgi:hypothetical protein
MRESGEVYSIELPKNAWGSWGKLTSRPSLEAKLSGIRTECKPLNSGIRFIYKNLQTQLTP